MSGVVHFKFKSALTYDSVQFNGSFVTVGELKALIAEKKGLGRDVTSELVLSDARSKVEFKDPAHMVAKSSSVLVRRVPAVRHQPMEDTPAAQPQTVAPAASVAGPSRPAPSPSHIALGLHPRSYTRDEDFGGDLYAERPSAPAAPPPEPANEEEKALHEMLAKKGQDYQRDITARGRGRGGRYGRGRGRGDPPSSFNCFRCGQPGHFAGDCPTIGDPAFDRKVRMPSGIPMSRLAVTGEGGLLLPGGQKGCLMANEESFAAAIEGFPTLSKDSGGENGEMSETGSDKLAAAPAEQQMVLYDSAGPGPPASTGPSAPLSKALVPGRGAPPLLVGENLIFPDSFEEPASEMILAPRPPQRPVPPPVPPPIRPAGGFWNMPPLVGNMYQAPPHMPSVALPPQDMVPQGPAQYVLQAFAPVMAGPLSKDDFVRMQEEARRKAARRDRRRSASCSRSPSRSRRRRRRSRSSSRDRGEDGRRRYRSRSRDRDSSRDRARRQAEDSGRNRPRVPEEFSLAHGMDLPGRAPDLPAPQRVPRLQPQTFDVPGMHGGPHASAQRGAPPNPGRVSGRRNGLGLPGGSGLSLAQQDEWAAFADDDEAFLEGPGERVDVPRFSAQRHGVQQDGGRWESGPSRPLQYGAGAPLLVGEDLQMPIDARLAIQHERRGVQGREGSRRAIDGRRMGMATGAAGPSRGAREGGRAAILSRSGVVDRESESHGRRRGAQAAEVMTRQGSDSAANGKGRALRAGPSQGDRHRERDGRQHGPKESRRREPKEDTQRKPKEAMQHDPTDAKQQLPVEKRRQETQNNAQQPGVEKGPDADVQMRAQPKEGSHDAPTSGSQQEAKGEESAGGGAGTQATADEPSLPEGENPKPSSLSGNPPLVETLQEQDTVEEGLSKEKVKKRKKDKKEKKEKKERKKRSRREYAGNEDLEGPPAYLPVENGGGSGSSSSGWGNGHGHPASPIAHQPSIMSRLGSSRWAPEEENDFENERRPQILRRLGRSDEAIAVEGDYAEVRASKHRRHSRHDADYSKPGGVKSHGGRRTDSLFARAVVAAVSEGPAAGSTRY